MDGLEWNKIAAAVLVAGLVAMIAGTVSRVVYHTEEHPEKRGYFVEVQDTESAVAKEVIVVPLPELLVQASVEKGAKIATRCVTCHSFNKGEPAKIGPNLWNIVGAKYAHMEGFSYSAALTAMSGTWNYEGLDHFLEKPAAYVKGTKMAFAGLSKPEERADMIAYLRSLSDSPVPLPVIEKKEETSITSDNKKLEKKEKTDKDKAATEATSIVPPKKD